MERTGVNLVLSSLRWTGESLNRKEAVAQLWSRNWMGDVSGLHLAMRRNFPKGKGGRTGWGELRIKFYDRVSFQCPEVLSSPDCWCRLGPRRHFQYPTENNSAGDSRWRATWLDDSKLILIWLLWAPPRTLGAALSRVGDLVLGCYRYSSRIPDRHPRGPPSSMISSRDEVDSKGKGGKKRPTEREWMGGRELKVKLEELFFRSSSTCTLLGKLSTDRGPRRS